MRLPPKMTPAQIAEAQRMACEWKRLGAPGKSRSECGLDERAAPREGSFARPAEPAGAPYEVGRLPSLSRAALIRITASMPRRTTSLSSAPSPSTSLSALRQRRSWKARSLKSCAISRAADFSLASRKSTHAGGSLVGGSANHDCDKLTCFAAGRGGSVTGAQSALLILTAALTS
jgi:hypothetical protein